VSQRALFVFVPDSAEKTKNRSPSRQERQEKQKMIKEYSKS
jgi:hypothetical protein